MRAAGVAVLSAGAWACGAGTPAERSEAGAFQSDGAAGLPEVRPSFGLSERPPNRTCRPPESVDTPAARLSATGCFDPAAPRQPAAGLIPYAVASSLWSDGAEKERFVALPEGERIHVVDCRRDPEECRPRPDGTLPEDGHFALPVGTVLAKTFLFEGKPIETRLLIRFDAATWAGYSYEWNQAHTDADLLPDQIGGFRKPVRRGAATQIWHFPGRAECLQCHTRAAGVSLGLETAQLNIGFEYRAGVEENQIAAFQRLGLFDRDVRVVPRYVAPGDPLATVEARARSYMHANCAICHRPGSNFESIDLRNATSFRDTGLCLQQPQKGTLGVAGAALLVPGDPARSLVALRMRALGDGRMPQIGTGVADADGIAVVEDWIRSLGACP